MVFMLHSYLTVENEVAGLLQPIFHSVENSAQRGRKWGLLVGLHASSAAQKHWLQILTTYNGHASIVDVVPFRLHKLEHITRRHDLVLLDRFP